MTSFTSQAAHLLVLSVALFGGSQAAQAAEAEGDDRRGSERGRPGEQHR